MVDKGNLDKPLTETIDESDESRIIPMFKSPRNETIHYNDLIIQDESDEDVEIHKTPETGKSPNIRSECATKNDASDTKREIEQNSSKIFKSNCQIKRSKESETQEKFKQNKVTNFLGNKRDKIITQSISKKKNVVDAYSKKNIHSSKAVEGKANLKKMESEDQMHKKNNYNYQVKIMSQPKVTPYKPRNSFSLTQKQVNISKEIINLRTDSLNKGLQEPGNLLNTNPRKVSPKIMDPEKKTLAQKINTLPNNDKNYTENFNNGRDSKSIALGNSSEVVKKLDTENINMCKIEDKHSSQEDKIITSNECIHFGVDKKSDMKFDMPGWYNIGSAGSHVNSNDASKSNATLTVNIDKAGEAIVIQENCIDKLMQVNTLANELEAKATNIPELIENNPMSSDNSMNGTEVSNFKSIENQSEASRNELDTNQSKVPSIKSTHVAVDTGGNSLKLVDRPNTSILLDLNLSVIAEISCNKEKSIYKEHILDAIDIPKGAGDEPILIDKYSIDNPTDSYDSMKISSDEPMKDNCTNEIKVFNLKSIDILEESDDNDIKNCTNITKVTNLNLTDGPVVPENEEMAICNCQNETHILGQKSIHEDNQEPQIEARSSNVIDIFEVVGDEPMHIENDTIEPEESLDIVVDADEKNSENINDEKNDLGLNNKNTITNSGENIILDVIEKSTTNDSSLTVAGDINPNINFAVGLRNNIDIISLDSSSANPNDTSINEKYIITNEKSNQTISHTEDIREQDAYKPADQINNIVEDFDDRFDTNGEFICDWTSPLNDNVLPNSLSPEESIDMLASSNDPNELLSFEKINNASEDKIMNEKLNAVAMNVVLDIKDSNSTEDFYHENISVQKSIQESESKKVNMVVSNNFDSIEGIFSENDSGEVVPSLSEDIEINNCSSPANSVEHSLNVIPNSTFIDSISNVSDLYLHENELINSQYENDIETTTSRKVEIPVDDVPVDLSLKKKENDNFADNIVDESFFNDSIWNTKFEKHLEQVLFEPERLSSENERMLKEFEDLYLSTLAVLPENGEFQQQGESTIDIRNNVSVDNVNESGINNMNSIQLSDNSQNQLYNDILLNDYMDPEVTNDFSVDLLLDDAHQENTQPASLSQIEKEISHDGDIIMNLGKLPSEQADNSTNNNNNEIETELEGNKETEVDCFTEFESFVEKNVLGNPDAEFLDLLNSTLERFRFNKNTSSQDTQDAMPEHDNVINNTFGMNKLNDNLRQFETMSKNVHSQQFLKQSADIGSKRRFYSQQINSSQSRNSTASEKSFLSQSSYSKNDSWDKRKFEENKIEEPGSPSESCSQALSRILREPRLPNILRKRRPIVKNTSLSQQPFNDQIPSSRTIRICSQPIVMESKTENNTADMLNYYSQQTAGPSKSQQINLNMMPPGLVQGQNVLFSLPHEIPPKKPHKHKKNKAKRNKNSLNSEKKKNNDAIRTRPCLPQPNFSNYYTISDNSYQYPPQNNESTYYDFNNYNNHNVSNPITLTPNYDSPAAANECNQESVNSSFMGATSAATINNAWTAPSNLNTGDSEMSPFQMTLSDIETNEILEKYCTIMG